MASVAPTSLARQLGSLFEFGSAAGLSDRQLLERFVAARDEDAFTALVARHGPMVLGTCRQHLGDHQHAEDAFQAVFLVLARRARSIRDPELLGNWLYGVALRTARTARNRLVHRRQSEEERALKQAATPPAATVDQALLDDEQAEALHVEIDRLPGAFRLPVVLCYFEGLTLDEAAHRLRWPVGTTRSRLARAREKLRRGLTRRGFAMSSAALAATLAPRSAQASVSSLLCESTTRAAIAFAARRAAVGGSLSATAAALAQEVLRNMLIHKLRLAAMSFLFLAVVAVGLGYQSLNASARSWEGEPPGEPRAQTARTEPRPADATPPDPARMTITGRVLDPAGKPLPNARVAVLADRKRQAGDIDGRHRDIHMGTAAADADGRFTLAFPAIPAPRLDRLRLIATAPGRGLGMVELETDAAKQETSIALPPEKPVEGRLVDVQGQRAAGVVVRLAKLNFRPDLRPYDAKGAPSLWPAPATTGADGRFRLLGLGPDAPATFEVEDPRFARQDFSVPNDGAGTRKSEGEALLQPNTTITLRPAQALDYHVVHADDGRPVAGARVDIQSNEGRYQYFMAEPSHDRTDGQGRARVVPRPGDSFRIHVYPPEAEPYVPGWLNVNWPKAAVQHAVEVKLRRGVFVRGRLIEDPAGAPVAGAWVIYFQQVRDNPRRLLLPKIEAVSGPDGTFTMVVPHGPGHLLVQGPSADYLHVTTSFGEMGASHRPSFRMYPDAHAILDIKDGEATHPLELRLRRGVTVTGRVIAPDGRPVAKAFVFGRSYAPYRERGLPMVSFNGVAPRLAVEDGRFEIPGCDPDKPSTFYILDIKDQLGGTVELSGQSGTTGPVTVRLQPTASARIRMTGADGRPLAGRDAGEGLDNLMLVITPGPDFGELNKNKDLTSGDFVSQDDLDRFSDRGLRSGADGRATLSSLIPGAPYRFRGRDFRPESGQTIDLGDVAVQKPPR
jgi:RNA polymerase sigma factor (sigma-70 family)